MNTKRQQLIVELDSIVTNLHNERITILYSKMRLNASLEDLQKAKRILTYYCPWFRIGPLLNICNDINYRRSIRMLEAGYAA
jgi:hypothetical protein